MTEKKLSGKELELFQQFQKDGAQLKAEIAKVITGQKEVIEQVIITILANGHSLITGVPGLAKTLLIKTISQCLDLDFSRIQFTPDLMPSDILGVEILEENMNTNKRELKFIRGPLFSQIILADEINRTSPKTQSALLQAMQEIMVTVGGETYQLKPPFIIFATQNPIDQEGTYPLPEAQLDRFLFNIDITYPSAEEEVQIVEQKTSMRDEPVNKVLKSKNILEYQELSRKVPIAKEVIHLAVTLLRASRPQADPVDSFISENVQWGACTRACQHLIQATKSRALLYGRHEATEEDLFEVIRPTLRHRIIPSIKALTEGITVENIINYLIDKNTSQ